jgi:crotonyl-CoA reductase
MDQIREAIVTGHGAEVGGMPLPESYRGVTVHKDEAEMFAGMATQDKDPRQSLHVDNVPLPEPGPGEAPSGSSSATGAATSSPSAMTCPTT